MPTTLYLRVGSGLTMNTSLGNGMNGRGGSAIQWYVPLQFGTSTGVNSGSYSLNTVANNTTGLDILSSGYGIPFLTEPLSSSVTISSTLTFNFYGNESSMSANATFGCTLERWGSDGTFISTIYDGKSTSELSTTANSLLSWTGSPTSTTVYTGERIRCVPWVGNVGTMGDAYNVSWYYNTGTGGPNVVFAETISFMTHSAGTTVYPTNVASDVSTSDVDYKAWTSRGT